MQEASKTQRALIVSKGHPFDEMSFSVFLKNIPGVSFTNVEHPDAEQYLAPERAHEFDAYVFYDMPGLQFDGSEVVMLEPSSTYKEHLFGLLNQGKGMVFLHHAIAAWPTWSEYTNIIGGRFYYQETEIDGALRSDSGYRHEVEYTSKCLQHDHPVLNGVPAEFDLTDELYLIQVDEARVTPLLASDYSFTDRDFYSATLAVKGQMFENAGWSHPQGTSLIGWAKEYEASLIVYLQPGDGPSAYENAAFQRLVGNAIAWVV